MIEQVRSIAFVKKLPYFISMKEILEKILTDASSRTANDSQLLGITEEGFLSWG